MNRGHLSRPWAAPTSGVGVGVDGRADAVVDLETMGGGMGDHRIRSSGAAGSYAAVRAAPNVGAGHARD